MIKGTSVADPTNWYALVPPNRDFTTVLVIHQLGFLQYVLPRLGSVVVYFYFLIFTVPVPLNWGGHHNFGT